MSHASWIAGFVGAGLLVPGLLAAQGGVTVELFARAGLAAPDEHFYEVFANFSGDGPVEWTNGSLGRSFVAGLGLEVRLPSDRLRLRAEILRTFDTWLLATHSIVRPRVLFEPPEVKSTFLDVPSSLTLTSLQLVLPTRLEVWRFTPYALGGVGGKRYGFGESTRPNEVEAVLPSAGFTWAWDLGGGLTVDLLGLGADVQVRDVISRYWGKTNHDLLVTGGIAWRPW